MSTTTTISPSRLEDYLLAGLPIITALVGFNWSGIVPGASGFLIGVAIASFAKSLLSLGQNPSWKSWDDIALFAFTFIGVLATALMDNPAYLVYGTVLGFVAKAANVFQNGFNIEDALLFVGAVLAAYGQYIGNVNLTDLGLLIGVIGKALPSLANVVKTPPAPAPPAPATPAG